MSLIGIALPLLFLLSLRLGSVYIPLADIVDILVGKSEAKLAWQRIIWDYRLPKALTAILAGAGLSLSGLMMQTLFRNPLAGPFVLGISSGAGLGVAIWVMAAGSLALLMPGINLLNSSYLVIAASLGAFLVLSMVLLVSIRVKDSMVLLIAGLMFGTFAGAIVSVLQYFSEAERIQAYLIWTFGNLGGLSWYELSLLTLCCVLGIGIGWAMLKPLNALLLGEHYAESMGIPIKSVRLSLIVATSLLAGSVTAFCGPLAFLGLAVPHMARMLFQTADHRILIPASLLIGADLLLLCDMIAQMPTSARMLPINAVTSLFGAPVVIWLILKGRQLQRNF
jgi:iron complex transport system permease protein